MRGSSGAAERDGVQLTNLDQPLFEGAGATKRDLVEYLDGVRELILPELEDRPLPVIRVHRGQEAFMQKNVPKYTPASDRQGPDALQSDNIAEGGLRV
ncbi:MAG TPA: hypothetical protein VGR26_16565 [Acidimicrobiales bacterium]|nr:hypothetical protein [Acidimicrobiales bacterium]